MTKLTLLSRAAATATAALGLCLVLCACPIAAFAASGAKSLSNSEDLPLNLSSSGGSGHTATSTGGASLVRTIVGLAIVIAVIWGLTWVLRQVKAGRDPQVSSAGLQSVAALTLGAGRSVHLVKAGSEYVLLGSAEHGVVPIHRYSEQEAREAGLLAVEAQPPRRRAQLLKPRAAESAGHDPMRMGSPNSALIDRMREWTVRR